MAFQGIRRRPKASQRKRIRKREDAAADRPRDVGMRIQEELFGMTEEGGSQPARSYAAEKRKCAGLLGQVELFGMTEEGTACLTQAEQYCLSGAMGIMQASRTCLVTPLRPSLGDRYLVC